MRCLGVDEAREGSEWQTLDTVGYEVMELRQLQARASHCVGGQCCYGRAGSLPAGAVLPLLRRIAVAGSNFSGCLRRHVYCGSSFGTSAHC